MILRYFQTLCIEVHNDCFADIHAETVNVHAVEWKDFLRFGEGVQHVVVLDVGHIISLGVVVLNQGF